jgi:hypothetical protein
MQTGGGNGPKSNRLETPCLWTSEVPIRGDLHGRHAVSVKTKTRQKVSNLAKIEKTRQKVSNLALGQKVSNPMIIERGLEHDARPEDGWGKPVGQSSAPRPRSPGGQSPVRLLRGSIPSENTGLTARRPKGPDGGVSRRFLSPDGPGEQSTGGDTPLRCTSIYKLACLFGSSLTGWSQ